MQNGAGFIFSMANKIAIAHNKNDNVETVFMHMLRGSGIAGLQGIKPYREGKYIRPLIKCERVDIEKYCEENKLEPKFDESNKDNTYTRNKIRNLLIPYIKKEFNVQYAAVKCSASVRYPHCLFSRGKLCLKIRYIKSEFGELAVSFAMPGAASMALACQRLLSVVLFSFPRSFLGKNFM